MPTIPSRARARALRASLAVTLGGALAVGCGTSQTDDDRTPDGGTTDAASDTSTDTATDTTTDVAPDTTPDVAPDTPPADVGASCSDEPDDVCPEGCSIDEDYDCCMAFDPDWCTYDPEWGCGCAVEGPFAPPDVRG